MNVQSTSLHDHMSQKMIKLTIFMKMQIKHELFLGKSFCVSTCTCGRIYSRKMGVYLNGCDVCTGHWLVCMWHYCKCLMSWKDLWYIVGQNNTCMLNCISACLSSLCQLKHKPHKSKKHSVLAIPWTPSTHHLVCNKRTTKEQQVTQWRLSNGNVDFRLSDVMSWTSAIKLFDLAIFRTGLWEEH